MEKIKTYHEFDVLIKAKETFLLYAHTENCGVCLADRPKVQALAEKYKIKMVEARIEDIPDLRGQVFLFSAPSLTLYYQGKEYHRQARILNWQDLESRLMELAENS